MHVLDYACYLNASGYSQAAVDTILALDESGKYDIRISCFHKMPIKSAFSPSTLEKIEKMLKKPSNNDAIRVFHCIPDQQSRFDRLKRNICFATFETYDPPEHWIKILNRFDAVICPSFFDYKIFAHAGIFKPLFHIPHCLNTNIWNENVIPIKKYDRFTFLFFGAWKKRKGWTQLIEAWCREFKPSDNVQLLIKTDKSDIAERDIGRIVHNLGLQKKDIAPILYEKNIFDDNKLPSFFKSVDCYISPTLGEGFGLPGLQCMAIKVPVIITNFSGCQDYAKNDLCYLLEPTGFLLHESMDGIPQFKNKKWPRIEVKTIQNAMRHVINDKEGIQQKIQNSYKYIQSNFSYQEIVKKFDDIMEIIDSGKP